jgi:hypothetical protein
LRHLATRWNFSLTQSFHPHYGPWVHSNCNGNEYQAYFVGGRGKVALTNLPPSFADCVEIWEPPPPAALCFASTFNTLRAVN